MESPIYFINVGGNKIKVVCLVQKIQCISIITTMRTVTMAAKFKEFISAYVLITILLAVGFNAMI